MRLTNREIYNYFEYFSIVKSHKLADVIRKHCLNVELVGGLGESVSDIPQGEFPNFLRMAEYLLNSDAIGRKFGSADVYEVSEISHTPDRIPGSRATTDRNNDRRKGKGACWQ